MLNSVCEVLNNKYLLSYIKCMHVLYTFINYNTFGNTIVMCRTIYTQSKMILETNRLPHKNITRVQIIHKIYLKKSIKQWYSLSIHIIYKAAG